MYDIIIVGGGSAGLTATIFAAERGAHVLLLEAADVLGGTLWVATGQMSAAGTRLQRERGIADSPDAHFADVIRISRGTINPGLARLAIDNAAATFDWLMERGFEPLPEHPIKGFGHEPYSENRYYWGEKGGVSVKDVMVPIVEQLVAAGKVDLRLKHEATALRTDAAGDVVGVTARDADGVETSFEGASVVLTTGGYAADPAMFAALSGYPLYNAAPYPFSRGAGLRLGEAVGGYLRGHENVFNNFGTLYNSDSFPARALATVETFPERREPWEIYVNVHGQRFIREDIRSVDAREMALSEQPDRRYWIVFDQAILDEAPPMIVGWSREQMVQAFAEDGPAFAHADTLAGLAAITGIDADGLAKSVAGFNYGVQTGNDFFGRTHAPRAIGAGPFYAIRMQGSSISSAVGLAVDDTLRVIRPDGSVVGNLYAAGELLGSGQTMGKAACGGMMVTPALTFGRLLGERLAPVAA
ncbi:FAD-dependent oxidoreductase [Sphingomonas sp. HITSZ_GF]|uniref:FAD-dependent oxidoreductase n=1 Tax=Sphingomonas sp. HITSZ_GF TaxID=3037247 RepID=UPI00240D299C|nr:FAD-dependent oxidoreductase [Sphingomonas sp. HITSZ_GF]MDG2532151.1 FAD-dependent oxidoreductase [Sphingomonas sp. HITSZ_GF]